MSINEEELKKWIEQVTKKLSHLEANQTAIINGDFQSKDQPAEPLIKDERIRKAVRAWAEALDLNEGEVEFYGNKTWIGFRPINNRTGWSSKFEVDYFGSENEFVPFKRYSIAELCGEEEE